VTPQVLVVGAGPAELVAAITLTRYRIRTLVVDKRRRISTLSGALVISTRSTEIIRSWGLEDAVRTGAADVESCGWVTHTQDHFEPLLLALRHDLATAEVRFGADSSASNRTRLTVASIVDQESGRTEHLQPSFVIAPTAHTAPSAPRSRSG
jgi:putative polyketide hydroxylase